MSSILESRISTLAVTAGPVVSDPWHSR
jgi:hypothetical protein